MRFGQQADDDAALTRAVDQAFGIALALTLDRDLALEVAQETAVAVLRSRRDLRTRAAERAWVRRIALRETWRQQNRSRREQKELAIQETVQPDGPASGGGSMPLADLLRPLSPRQRDTVFMRFVLDLDDATIGATLGCRPSTVRSLLSRALERLRGEVVLNNALPPTNGPMILDEENQGVR